MSWRWCERCYHLGWRTAFDSEGHGRIETCPECKGHKGFEDPDTIRKKLGLCKFCSQVIYFPASDTPCTLGRKTHVIPWTSLGDSSEEAPDGGQHTDS